MVWVRGHAGNPLNERCDHLSVAAAHQRNLPADEVYEVGKPKPGPSKNWMTFDHGILPGHRRRAGRVHKERFAELGATVERAVDGQADPAVTHPIAVTDTGERRLLGARA